MDNMQIGTLAMQVNLWASLGYGLVLLLVPDVFLRPAQGRGRQHGVVAHHRSGAHRDQRRGFVALAQIAGR